MAIARSIRLAHRASDDLDEIWSFSVDRWGSARADRYVADLRAAIARLIARPEQGRPTRQIDPIWRVVTIARHRIFYRFDDREVYVARILHVRMDEGIHLP